MKAFGIALIAISTLCLLGCSKHFHGDSAKLSFELKNSDEASTFENELVEFAKKNGFNTLTYENHFKKPDAFSLQYSSFPSSGPRGISFGNLNSNLGKDFGECLVIEVYVVTSNESESLKPVLKQLNEFLHDKIHDGRTIFVDTECGVKTHPVD